MLVDYHVHLLGHLEVEDPSDRLAAFIETALGRGISEIGFADHDRYADLFDFSALRRAGRGHPGIRVLTGIEVDFAPEKERDVRALLHVLDLDYAIGSVHAIDGWVMDHPKQMRGWDERDTDQIYRDYYGLIVRAVASGLFDIVGHLDLPKVFGYRPRGDASHYAEPAVRAIAQAGCAIEINTNGKYKPAGEMYPERDILAMCFAADIPVTLGSDAHVPENAGRDIELARDLARRAGYSSVATFSGRKRVMQAI